MYSPATKNRIIAPITIGITLILGVILLRPMYYSYLENTTTFRSGEALLQEKNAELSLLLSIKNNASSGLTDDVKRRLEKIEKKFDTSEIMQVLLLNNYTKSDGTNPASIKISSITVEK
jgi:hypothetical protein